MWDKNIFNWNGIKGKIDNIRLFRLTGKTYDLFMDGSREILWHSIYLAEVNLLISSTAGSSSGWSVKVAQGWHNTDERHLHTTLDKNELKRFKHRQIGKKWQKHANGVSKAPLLPLLYQKSPPLWRTEKWLNRYQNVWERLTARHFRWREEQG